MASSSVSSTVQRRTEGLEPGSDYPAPTLPRDGASAVGLYRQNMLRVLRGGRPARVDVPVQLIVPLRDAFVAPALSADVERWTADARRHEVDAGHWVIRTNPQLVADRIAGFADEIEAR